MDNLRPWEWDAIEEGLIETVWDVQAAFHRGLNGAEHAPDQPQTAEWAHAAGGPRFVR